MEDIMNKTMVIYKAIFPNGKCYIGQTRRKFKERYKEHEYASKRLDYNYPFYNAIRKYGFENLKWEILKECKDFNDLNKYEIKYIEENNSFIGMKNSKGYNATIGGQSIIVEQSIKLKNSEIFYINKMYEEGNSIIKISEFTNLSTRCVMSNIVNYKKLKRRYRYDDITIKNIKYNLAMTNKKSEQIALENNCSIRTVLNISSGVTNLDKYPEFNDLINIKFKENKNSEYEKLTNKQIIDIKIDLSLGYSVSETSHRNKCTYYVVKNIQTFKNHKYILEHLNKEIDNFKIAIRRLEK